MFQNQLGYRNSKRELGTEIERERYRLIENITPDIPDITQGIHKYRSAVV